MDPKVKALFDAWEAFKTAAKAFDLKPTASLHGRCPEALANTFANQCVVCGSSKYEPSRHWLAKYYHLDKSDLTLIDSAGHACLDDADPQVAAEWHHYPTCKHFKMPEKKT